MKKLAALLLALLPSLALAAEPEALRLPRPKGGEWHGVFLLGKKAGWSFADLVPDTYEGAPAVKGTSIVVLRVAVGGNQVERVVEDVRWYERKDGGRLLGFTSLRKGDGGDRRITGDCEPKSCAVKIEQDGKTREVSLPHPGETLEDADPARLAAARKAAIDATYLDLDTLKVKKIKNRFLGEETRFLAGVEVKASRVGAVEEGETIESVATLATTGELLELKMAQVMTAIPQPEAEAKQVEPGLDVFTLTKVPLPKRLPPGAKKVTLVVEGLPREFRRADARQRFEELPGGKVRITLEAVRPKAKAKLPVDRARFEKELARTEAVDADDPTIHELARKLVPKPEGQDALAVAGTLVGWVHGGLEKAYGKSSDRASLVLAQRRGDCTEHSILLAALSRSLGLPARTVHGLVSASVDGTNALFWHEWVEVWAGEWVAVDPTFGQPIADATHLALGTEGTTSSVALLGQLKVLEATAK